jgi:Protein of unknown function (DUF4238)
VEIVRPPAKPARDALYMALGATLTMNAQNQHYVPKFILRQFLADHTKERVHVYDKHTDRSFVTSVKNIMAERRFNDFVFEDWIVSFEGIACGIENIVLPCYRRVIARRQLDGSPHERADLAYLIAFQMLRSKAHREFSIALEDEIRQRVEAEGGRMEDIKGWAPSTEDSIKQEHLTFIRNHISEFAAIISQKDFVLIAGMPSRSFYLGDHPVCLHNERDFGPYGNLGLAVEGIQIYMPLSADLMIGAWCPSVAVESRRLLENAKQEIEGRVLSALMAGQITAAQMRQQLEYSRGQFRVAEMMNKAIADGRPIDSVDATMDFYNSLQLAQAHRYVVSKEGDFSFARSHNRDFPELRRGRRPQLA